MDLEIWKEVEGCDGQYQISNLGRVKSLIGKAKRELILKECLRFGYAEVSIYYKKKYKATKIHRLVAQAFIPNPENKPWVNHINGIKSDNRVENLEWSTPKENTRHAWENGLCNPNKKIKFNQLNNKTMKNLLLIASFLTLFSCTDEKSAKRVLESNGYSEIRFTGYDWFACSKDDFYHTGFRAKSANGSSVKGCVCEGMLFKGSTIRFD